MILAIVIEVASTWYILINYVATSRDVTGMMVGGLGYTQKG